MIHVVHTNDRKGDLVDVEYFGSQRTMFLWLEDHGVTYYSEIGSTRMADGTSYEYGAWPGGAETDCPVYDGWTGDLLWEGMHDEH